MNRKQTEIPEGTVPLSYNNRVIWYRMKRNGEIRQGQGMLSVRKAPKAKKGMRATIIDERNLGGGCLVTIRLDLDSVEAKQVRFGQDIFSGERCLVLDTTAENNKDRE